MKARSRVGGSVQVKQGGSARGPRRSRVNGDIQYDANEKALKAQPTTSSDGSIQAFGNFGGVRHLPTT